VLLRFVYDFKEVRLQLMSEFFLDCVLDGHG
jgi:hypothetical protein